MALTNTARAWKAPLLVLLLASGLRAERVASPNDVFYYQPAATVFGMEAVWVNPAALARYRTPGFQLMADYRDGDYGESWGGVIGHERTAVAFRKINNPHGIDFDEWIYAAGVSTGGGFDLGFSYRYFKNGPDFYNKRHLWNLGLSGHKGGPLSWAAVFSNLNRGRIDGERSEMEQRYSLAYRPAGPRLTLAADMFLSTKTRLRDAEFVYHAEFVPTPGLFIAGSVDSDRNFQIGVRANLLKYFVGHKSGFDRHGKGGRTTAYVGLTSGRQPTLISEPGRRLEIAIAGKTAENPPRPVFGTGGTPFARFIMAIYRAADDPSIDEMLLSLHGLSIGFGQAQELRQALDYFKARNKQITCHLTAPNNISYYVATIADRILIPPVSQLNLTGLRAELTFYAGTLDKLGVKADLVRIGEYKTAPEVYTRSGSSEENREQINRLLDDLYEQFVTGLAVGRQIAVDSAKRIVDAGPFTSTEALAYGLVDGLSYRDEVTREYMSSIPEISFRRYLDDTLIVDDWCPTPVLALIVAEGELWSDSDPSTTFGTSGKMRPGRLRRALDKARKDADVKAVILRVNSPGGSALASEEMFHDLSRASLEKPLVVSMGNQAASGGYYICMMARRVFANPATVTGSIGIYGGKVDFSGLYEKISLGKELYLRGRYAGMLSTIRPFSQDERAKYRSHLRAFYGYFVELVARNRQLETDSVDVLGRGRVWTGREALANGLVDEVGGLKRSLDYTAGQLGLDDYRVAIYPEIRPLFLLPGRGLWKAVKSLLGSESPKEILLGSISELSGEEFLLARMPFDIEIR